MRVRPITREALVTELADQLLHVAGPLGSRIALDGHPLTGTRELADSLVEELRTRGRRAVRVSTWDYLRPASLRLERGRTDPEVFLHDWFDFAGLSREVLAPLAAGGDGCVLPALWDPDSDRSPREPRTEVGENGAVLVEGPFLLGKQLDFDFSVHLWMSEKVLRRKVPTEDEWQLPAYSEYAQRARPQRVADRLVRADRPERPALVDSLD
ncbi:uridine kinase [Actinopolyspora saharensis]|uniref:uridine kinase n=1 Tax=Actinopolyspora saharensis TaxID=995062 RepID=UPI003F676366